MTDVKQSRNAREGRFLGYSHLIGFYRADGKHARRVLRYRTRVASNTPTGIAENYREERFRLRLDRLATRYDLDPNSVKLFYGIAVNKAFTRQGAYEAFAHVVVE